MTNLSIRWGGLLVVAIALVVLTYHHYQDNIASLVPHQVRKEAPAGEIRVLGMVQGRTLKTREAGEATFTLLGKSATLARSLSRPAPR